MTKYTFLHGCQKEISWLANVPKIKAPKIASEKVIEGVRYYFGKNGKQYVADLYDKMFAVQGGKIKSKFFKGTNPSKKVIFTNA